MSKESDGNQNSQSAKVLKLGLNISVSGDPGTDFEIVLDDKEQRAIQLPSPREEHQYFDALGAEDSSTEAPKHELDKTRGVTNPQSTGAIPKHRALKKSNSSGSSKMSGSESAEDSNPPESNIISKINSTIEHFEKFSDHIKEIPRLRNRPLATSTPFSSKCNSRSESSLVYLEKRPRKFSHLYNYQYRRDYFGSSFKPKPDLFLKPLPGEGYHTRGVYTRYFDFDLEPYRHYGSENSLNRTESKSCYGKSSYDTELLPEPPVGILKKSDSECGDKQSTSSADSVKDIKIYQSGGILIMQNFKENMDAIEKKEMSEFSAKLIENCNRLKMEVSGFQDGKPAIGHASDETKNSGKMVQFDLSSFDCQKSKSGGSPCNAAKEESSLRLESSESTSDGTKSHKGEPGTNASPQGTSHSQDFTSISTQENDSIVSNPPGLSPTCGSSKKLEWDSGADVGYLNLDLTKENLSTIEKIVLKGLSSDGLSEENVYERKPKSNHRCRSKLTLERETTDLIVEEDPESVKPKENRFEEGPRNSGEREKRREASPKQKAEPPLEEQKPVHKKKSTKLLKSPPEVQDKSVNVNTLFESGTLRTPPEQSTPREIITPSESPVKAFSRRFSHHSPKGKVSKNRTRPSNSRLTRTTKKAAVAGPLVASYFDMGNPKKVYKKVEANPALNKSSREVEEIIIDQRFKIKQNVASGRERTSKEPEPASEKGREEPVKEKKSEDGETKSRPISASTCSNNTVLPKSDPGEQTEEKKTSERGKFADEMIQTSDFDRASIGVQAFASQVSSDRDFRSFGRKREKKTEVARESVNTSSKNIQAFGLNSSLPKQLERPNGSESVDNQNTKSTQYFGGALNSLPNYHSNLATKPQETCGRAMKVLKTKRNSEAEIIRLKEENEKNILANDAPVETTESELKGRGGNGENKENLMSEKSNNSKKSLASRKRSNCTEGQEKEKKKSGSAEGSDDRRTSDDVSSLVLTSEVLKVHGDSIDRNIIQEKYFQSQLVELEKRKMISRSTSMEIQVEAEAKEFVTTACQYSLQSGGTSGGRYQEPEEESYKGKSRNARKRTSEGVGTRNQEQHAETGQDSLPSSTQTAHSWVPGIPNSGENSTGVGKARSFEYLPGHIYESSGNLREELPSETEQNLITSSSESDTARGSVSNDGEAKDSEGRQTLILENSTEVSNDSDRLKILDENLEALNVAVAKLREKDAQVQKLTKSLLANLHVENGSGDWSPLVGVEVSKRDLTDDGRAGSRSDVSARVPRGDERGREASIGCQTERRSPLPDSGRFYEERKAFEKRMSEEKKCQIKWIENEIYHLNILRRLLEKQSSPVPGKRKQSSASEGSSETPKSLGNYQKDVSAGICPRPVTPAYGCTISLSEQPLENSEGVSPRSNHQSRETNPCPQQYGVALSFSRCSKNWQRVLMLPASVQVSLKDADSPIVCTDDPAEKGKESERGSLSVAKPCKTANVHTQYPTARRDFPNCPSASVQTDLRPCKKENCFCLNLSDSRSTPTRASDGKGSSKLRSINEEFGSNHTTHSTDPEFLESDNNNRSKKTNEGEADGTCEKSRTVQSASCKCRGCPKREVSPCSKCRGPWKSNVYLTCDKSPSRYETCRCSKIQVQKSSSCTCHVIKIHGSRCCSSERNICPCKASPRKKTENQFCQTECDSIKRDLKENGSGTERTGVHFFEDVKKGKPTCESEPGRDVHRTNLEGKAVECGIPAKEKTFSCSCGRKKDKEKDDDHPRHYFLRIEETEMDDLVEETRQKKSLEVVTVTIPVKKAGKSKIYGSDIRQSHQVSEENLKPSDLPVNECRCCADCVQNRKAAQSYEPPHLSKAEKPESPTRFNVRSKSPGSHPYEEYRFNYPVAPETRYCDKPTNDSYEMQCREGCNCTHGNSPPSREFECDSQKTRTDGRELYEERSPEAGWSSDRKSTRYQGVQYSGSDHNADYFNYNKREYMTRSELRKEEEKKRKVHQPSLQECLSSNRPDFYNSAERRRQIISERAKERVKKHNNRMECLMKMMQTCNRNESPANGEPKRIFTSVQMKEQTMKRYKKLPEVTEKIADEKKREEYRTNRLMADIFGKKLQSEALKGGAPPSPQESDAASATPTFALPPPVRASLTGPRCSNLFSDKHPSSRRFPITPAALVLRSEIDLTDS